MKAIRELLGQGRFLDAYDRIEARLEQADGDRDALEVQRARVLERMGMLDEAEFILRDRISTGHRTEEALGLLASLLKRRGFAASASDQAALLREAEGFYRQAFVEHRSYWSGVNLALFEFLRDERDAARTTAEAVLGLLREAESTTPDDEFSRWIVGTRAEACLIAGRVQGAVDAYALLRELCAPRAQWEQLSSARRNARRILDAAPADWAAACRGDIERALSVPPVLLAVGHRLDAPGRSPARLPGALLEAARAEIDRYVGVSGCAVGFASLAAGTDVLFHEVLEARGMRRLVLLPYDRVTFCERNELGQDPAPWAETFERLLESAERICEVSRHPFGWDALCYRFANEVTLGLAMFEAERLDTDLVGLALFDGDVPDGPGGTADTVALWKLAGVEPVHLIRPQDLTGSPPAETARPAPRASDPTRDEHAPTLIAGLLFADARGFSQLDESQTALFVERYFGTVAGVQAHFEGDLLERNTWGDALFYAFRSVDSCARFALEMRATLEQSKAEFLAHGLPAELGLRVALHAGPVRMVFDRVTGTHRVAGTQISLAARMEPIALVGQIVASEAFAALSKSRGSEGYACHYMGIRKLAKGYGEAPLYRVERA